MFNIDGKCKEKKNRKEGFGFFNAYFVISEHFTKKLLLIWVKH